VRPVLDLHSANDLKSFGRSQIKLPRWCGNSKARFPPSTVSGSRAPNTCSEQLGDELLGVMREIKRMFDPKNIFNPGKIFAAGSEPGRSSTQNRQLSARNTSHDRWSSHSTRCSHSHSKIIRSSATWNNATAAAVALNKPASCAQRLWPPHEEVMSYAWTRQHNPRGAETARQRARSLAFCGIGRRTEQLSLLQRVHSRMPVQREFVADQSGIDACAK
jgi:hypothetical protein